MAETIVAELIKVIFLKMEDEGLKQIVRAKGVRSQLLDLGCRLSMMQDLLNDAADKEIVDKNVKIWLNRLQHLAYDIDDLLDGLATDAMHRDLTDQESGATTSKVLRKFIPTYNTDFKFSSKLHPKLDSIATKLQQLEKDAQFLGLIVKYERPRSIHSRRNETWLPDSSDKIVGREREIKELLHKLLGDDQNPCRENFSVVPIVGMGGVGKTTLARSLFNETHVKDHFEIRVWVCVSDDLDVFKISETIFRVRASENKEFKDLNEVQVALSDILKEKRFLLVLDDIWCEKYVDWENLVKPFHSTAPGSKIIMTTRKEGLLKHIGFDHLDKLECLSHDDAMSLLARHALDVDNFDSHTDLKPHGESVVKNCGHLPLALTVVGRLLRTETNEQYWEHVLNSKIWQMDDNIVPALRLSYLELSACSKRLFAYCSFFPKDFLFDKRELILLWVAEGFIKKSTGSMLTEESLGHEYFEDLLSRSFFQRAPNDGAPNDESLFVMHDLMNDLATFVAEDFFLRLNDHHMKMKTKALKTYRHMSFIREKYVGYQKFEAFESAKCLRTLLALSVGVKESLDCFYLSNKILVDLLPELPFLRVLSLSGFQISEVPKCIGHLKHLRYLNLSQTKIKELPENVGNLYNLQSLIVFGCDRLCKLPKSFSKLKNLRHLDIRDTPLLKQMPIGIGKLNSLQTLSKMIIEGDDGFAITELKELNNLEGKICIEGLDKVQDARHAQDARLSEKRLSEVELAWSHVYENFGNEALENEVLSALKPCNYALKKFKITSYSGRKFPNWIGDPSFSRLVHVWIGDCRNCEFLPALGRIPSLKELVIEGMDKVKVMGSELLGDGSVAFPCLEILSFKYMFGWSVWSMNSGIVDAVFPCLRELNIYDCPELVDISLESLPSLQILRIDRCGASVLKSMVHVALSVTRLVISNIRGLSDEVWRGVIKNLRTIEEVTVHNCNEIRYIWKSGEEASKVLVKLKYMWESEKNASKFLVNLRSLEVIGCEELVRLGEKDCTWSIETLKIKECGSITSVSFPTREERGQGMEKLKVLSIIDCKELVVVGKEELVRWGENTNNTQMLEYIEIESCPNLKSMNGLLNFIHLTYLSIWNCENYEVFPDFELPNLTSLAHMTIVYCPSMDDCFPRGYWPPKLTSLLIGGLKKPISEWGPQNFPTSLVKLGLIGGENDYEARNLNLLSFYHLFPSNLTHLGIEGFENLETVSVGLQHLTSLQHLRIGACPKLKDLPEKLLPSLMSLEIYQCPKLKEKSEKGSFNYWSKISHIPCIEIDGELQN